MTTRTWSLLIALPVLGLIYVLGFTDWLKPTPIEIIPSVRAILPKKAYGTAEHEFAGVYPVIFNLDAKYELTEIRVENPDTGDGKQPQVLWHLRSNKGSAPVKAILYGRDLEQMDPVPGSPNPPLALIAGKPYKVYVRAGRRTGEASFSTRDMADLRPNF